MTSAIPSQEITYKVIGAAMRVHNELGPGLKETIYHRALTAEMARRGLSFESEKPVRIEVQDNFAGLLYRDEYVEDSVVVEIKALSHLMTDEEIAQVITYLAATEAPVGLLINFGRGKREYKRVLPPKNRDAWRGRISRYLWKPPIPDMPSTEDEMTNPKSVRLSVLNPLTTASQSVTTAGESRGAI